MKKNFRIFSTLVALATVSTAESRIIQCALPIYVGLLPEKLAELDAERHYTVMCESGARATIAASVLARANFANVDVFLGSIGAWEAAGFSKVKPE